MSDKTFSLEHIIRNIAEGKFTPSDEPKVNLSHAIRNVHEAVGNLGTDKYKGTEFMGVRTITPHISPEHHSQAAETVSNARKIAKQKTSLTLHGKVSEEMSELGGSTAQTASWPATEDGKKKKKIKEESEPSGTVERRKVKFIARPDDADPKSPKSVLGRTGQIKTKIVDEEKVIKGLTDVIIDPPLLQASPDGDKVSGNRPQKDRLKKIVKESMAGNIATKAASNVGKKLIPGLGLAYGAADAYSRAKSGDYVGAGMAGLSGIASTIPGAGTVASAALDAANLARDYKAGAFDEPKPEQPKPPEPAKQPEQPKPVSTDVNKPKPVKQTKPFKGIRK